MNNMAPMSNYLNINLKSGASLRLFEKNMTAIKKFQPDLYKQLNNINLLKAKLVGKLGTSTLNIDIGHTLFYADDAETYAEKQVQKFFNSPRRINIANNYKIPLENMPQKYLNDILNYRVKEYLLDNNIELPYIPREDDGQMVLVLGMGLGFHIPKIIERTELSSIMIVEEFAEFVYLSLFFQPVHQWYKRCLKSKGTCRILIGKEPVLSAEISYAFLNKSHPGIIDGSYVFNHYRSRFIQKLDDLIREKMPSIAANPGFFEDEILMLKNVFANISSTAMQFFTPKPRIIKEIPAVIVGSGPSLDNALPFLKAHKDQVLIISCGTSLSALLNNGIKPDFHTELENIGPDDTIGIMKNKYDLSGITMVASSSVPIKTKDHFDETIFYWRSAISPCLLFPDGKEKVSMAEPTVTNTGLRFAIGMSFREIYLIGVDMGTRIKDNHHSKSSAYYTDKKKMDELGNIGTVSPFNLPVPGNFGGEVYTHIIFQFASMYMSALINQYDSFSEEGVEFKVYNASDGVAFEKAIPILPQKIEISASKEDKQACLKKMKGEINTKSYFDYVRTKDLKALKSYNDRILNKIDQVLLKYQQKYSTDKDYTEWQPFYTDLMAALDRPKTRDGDLLKAFNAAKQFYNGTWSLFMQTFHILIRRIDKSEHNDFCQYIMELFHEYHETMKAETTELFLKVIEEDRKMHQKHPQ